MSAIRFGGTLVAATLLTACTEPSRPNDGTTAPHAPFSPSAAGAASGAMVVRGEAFFLFVIFDAKNGLAAVLNGRDGIASCGEPFTVSRPGPLALAASMASRSEQLPGRQAPGARSPPVVTENVSAAAGAAAATARTSAVVRAVVIESPVLAD